MTGPDLRSSLAEVSTALGLRLSSAQVETLIAYLDLLQRWNAVYNLTAVRSAEAMLTQHLADCLAVIGPLRREVGTSEVSLLDVGSGGGLPAVVIATALPNVRVTSVDAVGKKAAFVRQVAGELRLANLDAVHGRIEQLRIPPADVISARAFASLPDFVRLSERCLRPGGRWMAMKGRAPDEEISALPATVEAFHVEQLEIPGLAAERCLVWLRRRVDSSMDGSL